MKTSTCFVTVVFPENIIYFEDFVSSINRQTCKEFHLLIYNDGVVGLVSMIGIINVKFSVVDLPEGLSIADNRTFVLENLRNSEFKYAVFGDSDDYFPSNRVEVNRKYLEDYDVVVNDIHLVNMNKDLLISDYFELENNKEINFIDLKDKNCCGLGNTAIQITSLPENITFNSSIAAVDWMLYSRILLEAKAAIYTNETFIYYRQHHLNAIGLKSITKDRLMQGVGIKLNHYKNLEKEFKICKVELMEFRKLSHFCKKEENLDNYLEKILSLNLNRPMWWEEIKTLKELKIKG
ncbi:hypothetical protein N9515_00915 [Vicingaceae bacterium]|nr:hypothetical protein [Vicingaceae bacterium]